MTRAFNNILIKEAKSKKHLSRTPDLQNFLIIPTKQRNDKLTGAKGHVREFSTFMQLLALKNERIVLCICLYSNFSG